MVTGQSAERGRRNWRRRGCILAVSILVNLSAIADGGAQDTRAMTSSFFRLPLRIGLVDVTPEAFGSRADEVRKVRAFTFPTVDRTTIYVNTDDPLWKHARSGEHREFYRAILASVVAHELWHLNHGASESGALREELRVWRSFILDKLVPTAEGLQHAVLLEQDIRAAVDLGASGHRPQCTSPRGRCCAPVRAHAAFAHIRCRTCRPRSGRCRRKARVDGSGPRGHFWRCSRRTGNRFQFMGPLARLAAPKVSGQSKSCSAPVAIAFGWCSTRIPSKRNAFGDSDATVPPPPQVGHSHGRRMTMVVPLLSRSGS